MSSHLVRLCVATLLLSGCSQKSAPKAEEKAPPAIDAAARRGAVLMVPQLMVLRQVLLESNDSHDKPLLDDAALAARFGGRLVRSGWLAARDSEVPEGQLPRRVEAIIQINYDISPASSTGPGTLVVATEATLEFIDARSDLCPRAGLIVEQGLSTGADHKALLQTMVENSLDSVAETLAARERLRRAPHEELLSVLSVGAKEAGLKIWALQLAADRGLGEAVPSAIEALSSSDKNVRAAATSALVSLGDERAVPALTDNVDFKDYEQLRVIMEAVSAIGGDDASEFLEFVAGGHPSDDIKERARESIDYMKRKR